MNESIEPPPRPDDIDAKMAEILAGDAKSISRARRRLRESDEPGAGDLLSRLDALDFVDSVVGQPGSDLPERLGEYRITDLLGRGGMGTVFEAYQESLERPVALKVLSPSLTTDSGMRRRFRAEARANATLHHQHIVPVYAFGESAGHLYFTMERVDGVSLDRHIACLRAGETELPEPLDVARRFAGVADALGHAHRRGILHRDVKPGNILVHPDGSYALADFGLSKMLGSQSMSLSSAGGFLGTLQYAAPEQARGRAFCPASDLYGLGVTMFETLTGVLPLEGKTTEAMLDAILHTEPVPLRAKLPKVPRDLDAVVNKLLSKEPDDRYQDGEALARDLLRVADDEPVRIRRLSPVVRLWRRVRKHPALSSAIVIAVLLLGAVLVLGKFQRDDSKRNRFERMLRDAAVLLEQQPGSPAGPDGLFAALTGYPLSDAVTDATAERFLSLVDRAAELDPDDERPALLRDAFLADPTPDATRALAVGEGVAARSILTTAIDQLEANSGLSTRDAPTLVKLYRLYLGRAVANLTASVADSNAASKDLIKASMLRRRAFFPRMLTSIQDWNVAEGVDALESSIATLLRDAPDGGRDAVGVILLTLARLQSGRSPNLMELDLDFGARRRLDELGTSLLTPAGPALTALGESPAQPRERLNVEAKLRYCARTALGSAQSRAIEIRRGRDLLDVAVAPGSPLQGWRLVLDLIEGVPNIRGLEPTFDPAEARRQIRGLTEYLRLEPPQPAIAELWPRAREVMDALPSTQGIAASRLRAMFAARVQIDDDAVGAADAWVSADANDPEAYFCRMRCWALRDAERAATDAVNAIRKAVDPDAMRVRVSMALTAAAEQNPDLTPMLEIFRAGS